MFGWVVFFLISTYKVVLTMRTHFSQNKACYGAKSLYLNWLILPNIPMESGDI